MARTKFTIATAGSVLRNAVSPSIKSPVYSQKVEVEKHNTEELKEGASSFASQVFGLGIKLSGEADFWQFPIEPQLSINGSNTIIRRNVAKMQTMGGVRGSVKERWNQDDYRLTISGILYNIENPNEYPYADVEKLRSYCEAKEVLQVQNTILQNLCIEQIVIESYEMPFTAGENVQAYTINAWSDSQFELFISTEE